ncbi:hypothetical protein GCM10010124_11030 [Pilimelia terevasa]|uniref:Excalibur calcium-binding domain-containing protein n=1 Tax=Pilimelia terevasa TaxID=53372 RepID=A0A8J3BHL5_9ACTN|nr:excalibur calcium-binding domain-containing protein [Pilimelia terevasa]GGK20190.1 hypothetical protein GCM10010124_11030 [Pilimelia terevasa]
MARRARDSSGNPILVVAVALGLCVVGFVGVITQAVREQLSADAAPQPVAAAAAPSSAAPAPSAAASPAGLVPGASPRAGATRSATPRPGRPRAGAPRTPFYSTCAQVRAAGKAPLRRTDPGYRARLDTDGDGVACEAKQGAGRSPTPR